MIKLFFKQRMEKKKSSNSKKTGDSFESFNDKLLHFMVDFYDIQNFKKRYQEFYINEKLLLAIRKSEVEKMRHGNEEFFDGYTN